MSKSYNPNLTFNLVKDWIGRGQAEAMRQHDARVDFGQTPLSLLVEDVKQDPQKHIQRLKRVMATAAVLATGVSSFNPNAVAQSQRPTQVETNTTQVQSNSEKEAVKTAETKVIQQFVNQVFNSQSEYSSMQRGGTPKAIQHALENGGTITLQNAPQIIMEAIKTNNGNTNPINLKHYKTQIKIFMINIELGYTPSEALIRSVEECAKQNPSEIKAPRQDLERLSNVAQDIRGGCIDAKVDATVGLSDTAKTQAKIELRKAKYTTPAEESKAWLRLMNEGKTPMVAPSTYSTPEAKDDIQDKAQNLKTKKLVESKTSAPSPSTSLNTSGQFGPFNNPNNPSVPPEAKVESTPDKGFEWFQTLNRKAIEDTLKQLGIILTVGGVATVAGIKGSKALYKKYQAWESTLPIISEDEARKLFWENINKIKSDYRKKKNFDAKLKLSKIDQILRNEEELSTTEIGEDDMQEFDQLFGNIPDNTNSADVKQINTNLTENTPISTVELSTKSTSQPIELKPKLGERWSSFIAGFRQKFNNLKTRITHPLQAQVENKKLYDQTKAREQGVIGDMTKFAEKKDNREQAHFSKLVFNIRSLYNNLLLGTQSQYEFGSKALIEEDRKIKESGNQNRQKTENKVRMENFEIPFVPETNEPTVEAIEINENMNQFSNHDLEAALLLIQDGQKKFQHRNLTGERSRFFTQARNAVKFLNEERKKYGLNRLLNEIKKDKSFAFPEILKSTGWFEDDIYRNYKKSEKESTFEEGSFFTNKYDYESFEHHLAQLKWQRKHFKTNVKIRNALDVVIQYFEEQETLVQAGNKIRQEIGRRPGQPSVQNENGKAEENKPLYYSYIKEFVNNLEILESFLKDLPSEIFGEFNKMYLDMGTAFGPYHKIKWGDTLSFKLPEETELDLSLIDYEKFSSRLNDIKSFLIRYKVSEKNFHYKLSDIEFMIRNNNKINAKLKLPANRPTHVPDIFTTDQEGWNDGSKWVINVHTIHDVQYRTSLMFPGVLEAFDEKEHILKVCSRMNIDLKKAKKAYSNPSTATQQEIKALQYANSILSNPQFKYRPFRKVNENVSQKPITIEELLLTAEA
jgi:hypothetical protein